MFFQHGKQFSVQKAGRNLCYYNSKFLPVSLFFCILCSISVLLRIVRFFFLWLFIECKIILAVLLHLIHGIIRTHDQLFQIIHDRPHQRRNFFLFVTWKEANIIVKLGIWTADQDPAILS